MVQFSIIKNIENDQIIVGIGYYEQWIVEVVFVETLLTLENHSIRIIFPQKKHNPRK